MKENDILSFVRHTTINSPKSVHERLYYDFSKRSYQSRLAESFSCSSVVKGSPRVYESRIEESLMQKQMASKLKLNKLKAKYQAEEMKEVRNVPQINEMSRLIAVQSESKVSDVKAKYIASILNNSRFVKMSKGMKGVKKAVIRLQDSEGSEGVGRRVKDNNETENNERNEYLRSLREAVNSRVQIMEPEEPPNLLEMGVVDRGRYWISQRLQKIEKIRKEVNENALKGCTFNPILTPRLRLASKTPRSLSVSTSYSQLYQNKKAALGSINHIKSGISKNTSLRNLSPAIKRFGYEAGGDFSRLIKDSIIKE